MKFVKLPQKEFEEKIEEFFKSEDDYYAYSMNNISDAVSDCEVNFDFENFEYTRDKYCEHQPIENIMGNCQVGDFQFCGCSAGGDWEWPVYFVLYWNGEKICAYIPQSSGNRFNRISKQAYGNSPTYDYDENNRMFELEYTEDAVDLKKQFPDVFKDVELNKIYSPEDVPAWTEKDVDTIKQELQEVFVEGEEFVHEEILVDKTGYVIWYENPKTGDRYYIQIPWMGPLQSNTDILNAYLFDTREDCEELIEGFIRELGAWHSGDLVMNPIEYNVMKVRTTATYEEDK